VITAAVLFVLDETVSADAWYPVRDLIKSFNKRREEVVFPGEKLCGDESMSTWKGRDASYRSDGLPHSTKIVRKPDPVGLEIVNVSDVETRIMLRLEPMEGKNAMANMMFNDGKRNKVLRLTLPWHGTGRTVVADSAFGGVQCCDDLLKHGIYSICCVKRATRRFPMQLLKELPSTPRSGEVLTMESTLQVKGPYAAATENCPSSTTCDCENGAHGSRILALRWSDKVDKFFISSCGTTLPSEPLKRKRFRDSDTSSKPEPYWKYTPIVKVIEEYWSIAPMIDQHNRYRQGTLRLERVWKTHKWYHRVYATIFGMVFTDAYFAYVYEHPDDAPDFLTFLHDVCLELCLTWRGIYHKKHDLRKLSDLEYYAKRKKEDKKKSRAQLTCRHCGRTASWYCRPCSAKSPSKPTEIYAVHQDNG
jgi:hypothetical protein